VRVATTADDDAGRRTDCASKPRPRTSEKLPGSGARNLQAGDRASRAARVTAQRGRGRRRPGSCRTCGTHADGGCGAAALSALRPFCDLLILPNWSLWTSRRRASAAHGRARACWRRKRRHRRGAACRLGSVVPQPVGSQPAAAHGGTSSSASSTAMFAAARSRSLAGSSRSTAAVAGRPSERPSPEGLRGSAPDPGPPLEIRTDGHPSGISSPVHRDGCPRTPDRAKAEPLRGRLRRALSRPGNRRAG
jgi:hypothetical protein